MAACARLQAVGDRSATTATETGLIEARKHLRRPWRGGKGRSHADKVVVLITDGVPNLYSTEPAEIGRFVSAQGAGNEFYGKGEFCKNAALMQVARMQAEHWLTFAVGVGPADGPFGNFMDRMARLGQTADTHGRFAPGSDDPAKYERRLTEIFEQIITNPTVRLVQ